MLYVSTTESLHVLLSQTSSSDGYNSDHGFESSGFVTSVYRSKNYDDIPDTVTRPPTIVGFDDDDDISLDRLDTFIVSLDLNYM